ncbi:sugar phosphate nucleotidyltransferase [Terriglobus saanensis]|uniref:Nucleotidyl transferase n=1 Tax=Terriglobus saanensis (strain ATCC BAA-1853 / DSM 23119 / SP1PR4) TaxID=401053 RepID=E8UYH2_TERSS|nr:sugar phosphate nucleotidyltransferase [Terriglobus saanensis]ADV82060.1 Nucleotidyl transferase [Terriglobus saanensis SP1PR4]
MFESHCAGLVMAGGRSSRMRRICATHKSLRTVEGVPLIEWNISSLLFHGIRNIFVAVNAREIELSEWIRGYGTDLAHSAGARLTTIVEDVPLGTIGAVTRLPSEIDPVLVVNVDNLTDLPLARMVEFHIGRGAAATIATHAEPFKIPFGRLETKQDDVTAYEEKPDIFVQISSGTCVFSRRAIDSMALKSRTDVPDLIRTLIASRERVAAFRHNSRWIDVNDEEALGRAHVLLEDRGDLWPGAEFRRNAHA